MAGSVLGINIIQGFRTRWALAWILIIPEHVLLGYLCQIHFIGVSFSDGKQSSGVIIFWFHLQCGFGYLNWQESGRAHDERRYARSVTCSSLCVFTESSVK